MRFYAYLCLFTQFTDNEENKCRRTVLEIMYRFPGSEILRPHVADLTHVALKVFQDDNEDNSLIALRILFDIHKLFRPTPEATVQPFLDTVLAMYRAAPLVIDKILGSDQVVDIEVTDAPAPVSPAPGVEADSDGAKMDTGGEAVVAADSDAPASSPVLSEAQRFAKNYLPNRGIYSFKLLTECPLVIMLLFQTYPYKYMQKNAPLLLPCMLYFLAHNPPLTSVSGSGGGLLESPQDRQATSQQLHELFASQVKTLSFVTYLLRGYADVIRKSVHPPVGVVVSQYVNVTSKCVVASCLISLLKKCPVDSIVTRKELLVGIRHILATDFRKDLIEHLPMFLDESFLLGHSAEGGHSSSASTTGALSGNSGAGLMPLLMRQTSIGTTTTTASMSNGYSLGGGAAGGAPSYKHSVLRPLTCSVYIDIVHYAKETLTVAQLITIIEAFCVNIHEGNSFYGNFNCSTWSISAVGLPLNIQIACLKMINDLIELLYNHSESDVSLLSKYQILGQVHAVLVKKLQSGVVSINKLDELNRQMKADAISTITSGREIMEGLVPSSSNESGRTRAKAQYYKKRDSIDDQLSHLLYGRGTAAYTTAEACAGAAAASSAPAAAAATASGASTPSATKCVNLMEEMKETKTLLKTLLITCKNINYYISEVVSMLEVNRRISSPVNGSHPVQQQAISAALENNTVNASNAAIVAEYTERCVQQLLSGMECAAALIEFSSASSSAADKNKSKATATPKVLTVEHDVIDVLDKVADSFVLLDLNIFRAVLTTNIYNIYKKISDVEAHLTMLQCWLAVSRVSGVAMDCLLAFLMQHLPALSYLTSEMMTGGGYCNNFQSVSAAADSYDDRQQLFSSNRFALTRAELVQHKQQAAVLVKLFRIVLKALSQKNSDNDKVLQPYLSPLVQQCMRLALECRANANNYYIILRTLFRTITVGNFEVLYREITPLLPVTLKVFMTLLRRTENSTVKNLLLELCLTIPARLQSLLPYIPDLFEIILQALQTDNDLPNLALRTLEFWIEHLNHNYIQAAMLSKEGLLTSLLSGIALHLRPYPYPYGMLAVRVFGKLGGRNKLFLHEYFVNNPASLTSVAAILGGPGQLGADLRNELTASVERARTEVGGASDSGKDGSNSRTDLPGLLTLNFNSHASPSLPPTINLDAAVLSACKLLMSNYGHTSSDIELLCNIEFYVSDKTQRDGAGDEYEQTLTVPERLNRLMQTLSGTSPESAMPVPPNKEAGVAESGPLPSVLSIVQSHSECASSNSYLAALDAYKLEVNYLYTSSSFQHRDGTFDVAVTVLSALVRLMLTRSGADESEMNCGQNLFGDSDMTISANCDGPEASEHQAQMLLCLLTAVSIAHSDRLLRTRVISVLDHFWTLFIKAAFSDSNGDEEGCCKRCISVVHSVIFVLSADLRPDVSNFARTLMGNWFRGVLREAEIGSATAKTVASGIIADFLDKWVEQSLPSDSGNITRRMSCVRLLKEVLCLLPFELLNMVQMEATLESLFGLLGYPTHCETPWPMAEECLELIHVLCINVVPAIAKVSDAAGSVVVRSTVRHSGLSIYLESCDESPGDIQVSAPIDSHVSFPSASTDAPIAADSSTDPAVAASAGPSSSSVPPAAPAKPVVYPNPNGVRCVYKGTDASGDPKPPVDVLLVLLNHLCDASMLVRKGVMIGLRALWSSFRIKTASSTGSSPASASSVAASYLDILQELSGVLSAMIFFHLDSFYQASRKLPLTSPNTSVPVSASTSSQLFKENAGALSALVFCLSCSSHGVGEPLINVDERVLCILNLLIAETDAIPIEQFNMLDPLHGIRSAWHLDLIIPGVNEHTRHHAHSHSSSSSGPNGPARPTSSSIGEAPKDMALPSTDGSIRPAAAVTAPVDAATAPSSQAPMAPAAVAAPTPVGTSGATQYQLAHQHQQQYHHHRHQQMQFQNYEASDMNLFVSFLCNGIPWLIEARLLTIRYIRAVFVHDSNELLRENWKEMRFKCFSVLFRSLSMQWEEIIVETQITLNHSISKLSKQRSNNQQVPSFPKDVMHECLRPLTKDVQDMRRLTVSTLKALESVLNLVTNKQHMSLANLFLTFLKTYCDSAADGGESYSSGQNKTTQSSLFQSGEEQKIAVSLMNIFHLLPWHTIPPSTAQHAASTSPVPATLFYDSQSGGSKPKELSLLQFTADFVEIVLQIEVVRFRYPHAVANLANRCTSAAQALLPSSVTIDPNEYFSYVTVNEKPKECYLLLPLCKFLYRYPGEGALFFCDVNCVHRRDVSGLLLRLLACCDSSIRHFVRPLATTLMEEKSCQLLVATAFHPVLQTFSPGLLDKLTNSPCPLVPAGISANEGPLLPEPTPEVEVSERHYAGMHHGVQIFAKLAEYTTVSAELARKSSTAAGVPPPILIKFPFILQQLRLIWRAFLNNHVIFIGPPGTATGSGGGGGEDGMDAPGDAESTVHTKAYGYFELIERAKTLMLCLVDHYVTTEEDSPTILFDIVHVMVVDFTGIDKHYAKFSDGSPYAGSSVGFRVAEHFKVFVPAVMERVIAQLVTKAFGSPDTRMEESASHQKKIELLLKSYFAALRHHSASAAETEAAGRSSGASPIFSVQFEAVALRVLVLPLMKQLLRHSNWSAVAKIVSPDLFKLIVVGTMGGKLGVCDQGSSSSSMDVDTDNIDAPSRAPSVSTAQGQASAVPNLLNALKVELLKLSTLLIQHASRQLTIYRKEMIKFAWNHLKSGQTIIRHTAYASMCVFISAYETPPKIILQVFVALLRAYLHEYNDLVRLSLDLLLASLPNRLKPEDFAKAMKWSKKIMLDELYTYNHGGSGSSSGNKRARDTSSSPGADSVSSSSTVNYYSNTNNSTTNILKQLQMWQIVLRHAELFYPYRSYFIAQMINTVTLFGGIMSPPAQQASTRGAPSTATTVSSCEEEMRRHVALGIVDVIINWEYYRCEKIKSVSAKEALKAAEEKAEAEKQLARAQAKAAEEAQGGRGSAKRVRLNTKEAADPVTNEETVGDKKAAPESREASGVTTVESREHDFTLQPNMIQLLGNFIIKLGLLETGISASSSSAQPSGGKVPESTDATSLSGIISAYCLFCFRRLLSSGISMRTIKFTQFDKVLRSLLEAYAAYYRSKLAKPPAAGAAAKAAQQQHPPSTRSLKLVLEYLSASLELGSKGASGVADVLLHVNNVNILIELLPYVLVNKNVIVVTEMRRLFRCMAIYCPMAGPDGEADEDGTADYQRLVDGSAGAGVHISNKRLLREFYYARMHLLLDNMIIKAANKIAATRPDDPDPTSSSNAVNMNRPHPSSAQQYMDLCPAWNTLLLLDELSGNAGDICWVLSHGTSLMKFAQALVKYHFELIQLQLHTGSTQIITSLAEHGQFVVYNKSEEEVYPTFGIRVLHDEVINGHVGGKSPTVPSATGAAARGVAAVSITDSVSVEANAASLCLCLSILGRAIGAIYGGRSAANSGSFGMHSGNHDANNAMEPHVDAYVHMLLAVLEHSDHPVVVYTALDLLQSLRVSCAAHPAQASSFLILLFKLDEQIVVNNLQSLGRFRNELLAMPVYTRSVMLYEALPCSGAGRAAGGLVAPLAGVLCHAYRELRLHVQCKYGLLTADNQDPDAFRTTALQLIASSCRDPTASKSRYWPVALSLTMLQHNNSAELDTSTATGIVDNALDVSGGQLVRSSASLLRSMEQICLLDLGVSDGLWAQYVHWLWGITFGAGADPIRSRQWQQLCDALSQNISQFDYVTKLTLFNEDRNLLLCGDGSAHQSTNSNSCSLASNLVTCSYNSMLHALPWRVSPCPSSVPHGLLRPFLSKLISGPALTSCTALEGEQWRAVCGNTDEVVAALCADGQGTGSASRITDHPLVSGCWFPVEFIAAVGSRFRCCTETAAVLECMVIMNSLALRGDSVNTDTKTAGGLSVLLAPVSTDIVSTLTIAGNDVNTTGEGFGIAPSVLLYNSEKAARLLLRSHEDAQDADMVIAHSRLSLLHSSVGDDGAVDVHAVLENALILEALGCQEYAQKLLHVSMVLMERQQTRELEKAGQAAATTAQMLHGDLDYEICGKRWTACARHLTQWDVLSEFAAGTQSPDMEAAAMLNDFAAVSKYRYFPSTVAALEQGHAASKLYDGMLAVMDSKFPEADRACAQAVQMCLRSWDSLPNALHSGSCAHREALHLFHSIIEIRESAGMVVQAKDKKEKDLKGMIKVWRTRLPDANDKYLYWEKVLKWRLHVFNAITGMLSAAAGAGAPEGAEEDEEAAMESLQDTPHTIVRLTKAARHHKLFSVSLGTITKLDTVRTMDVENAFAKVREHISCYLYTGTTTPTNLDACTGGAGPIGVAGAPSFIWQQRQTGLNMINKTNMDYFNGHQRAELLRLKGVFHTHLGSLKEAQSAFSESIQSCGAYGKTWLCWGLLCDHIGEQMTKLGPDVESRAGMLASGIVAILKAVSYSNSSWQTETVSSNITSNSQLKALTLLPKLIWLAVSNGFAPLAPGEVNLCEVLASNSTTLPAWVWLPHLRAMVAYAIADPSPAYGEHCGRYIVEILERVCTTYPQIALPVLVAADAFTGREDTPPSPSREAVPGAVSTLLAKVRQRIPTYYKKYILFAGLMRSHLVVSRSMRLYEVFYQVLMTHFVDGGGSWSGEGAAPVDTVEVLAREVAAIVPDASTDLFVPQWDLSRTADGAALSTQFRVDFGIADANSMDVDADVTPAAVQQRLGSLNGLQLLLLLRSWLTKICTFEDACTRCGSAGALRWARSADQDMCTESYFKVRSKPSGSSSAHALDLALGRNVDIPGIHYGSFSSHATPTSSGGSSVESLSGPGSNTVKLVRLLGSSKASFAGSYRNSQWAKPVALLGSDGHVYRYDALLTDHSGLADAAAGSAESLLPHEREARWSLFCKHVDGHVLSAYNSTRESRDDLSCATAAQQLVSLSQDCSLLCRGNSSSTTTNSSSQCFSLFDVLASHLHARRFQLLLPGATTDPCGDQLVVLDYLMSVRGAGIKDSQVGTGAKASKSPIKAAGGARGRQKGVKSAAAAAAEAVSAAVGAGSGPGTANSLAELRIPSNVLSTFLLERCSSYDKFVALQRLLANQLGVYLAIGALLQCAPAGAGVGAGAVAAMPDLHQLSVCVANGKVFMLPPPALPGFLARTSTESRHAAYATSLSLPQGVRLTEHMEPYRSKQAGALVPSARLSRNMLAALSPSCREGLGAAGPGALLLGALGVSFNCTADALLEDRAATVPLLQTLQNTAVSVSAAVGNRDRVTYSTCAREITEAGWVRLRSYSVLQSRVSDSGGAADSRNTLDAYVEGLLEIVEGGETKADGPAIAAANVLLDHRLQGLIEHNTSAKFAAEQPLHAVAWF